MQRKVMLILLCALLCGTNAALARNNDSPWYLGIKAGLMDPDARVNDDALNAGFDVGYRANRYFSGEFEYTDTVVDGETRGGADWEVSTLSAFAVLRSATPIKIKGKIGLTDIEYDNGDDDVEVSAGLGLGFSAAGGLTEVEYTRLGDELDFVSVGINFFY